MGEFWGGFFRFAGERGSLKLPGTRKKRELGEQDDFRDLLASVSSYLERSWDGRGIFVNPSVNRRPLAPPLPPYAKGVRELCSDPHSCFPCTLDRCWCMLPFEKRMGTKNPFSKLPLLRPAPVFAAGPDNTLAQAKAELQFFVCCPFLRVKKRSVT